MRVFINIIMGCLAICVCLAGLGGGCLFCGYAASKNQEKREAAAATAETEKLIEDQKIKQSDKPKTVGENKNKPNN